MAGAQNGVSVRSWEKKECLEGGRDKEVKLKGNDERWVCVAH